MKLRRRRVGYLNGAFLIPGIFILCIWIVANKAFLNGWNFKSDETSINKPAPRSEITFPVSAEILEYQDVSDKYRYMFNCKALFEADDKEIAKTTKYLQEHNFTFPVSDKLVLRATRDCASFRRARGYPSTPLTATEAKFPLAFVITVHKNIFQLEKLLRAVYQPQNVYCIHVDKKASNEVLEAVRSLVKCFANVFVASRLERVVYASMARLQADVNCMWNLVKRREKWKYLLNMASSEFPLRTNLELVNILKLFNGSNDVHEVYKRRMPIRFQYSYKLENDTLKKTNLRKSSPPGNLTVVKGQAYNTYSRAFVQFIFRNPVAKAFLQWCRDTYSPDEHFWATLNDLYHNKFLKTPGGYVGHPDTQSYITRFINWEGGAFPCHGRYVHRICVLGVGDLAHLHRKSHLVANKFDTTVDPVTYSCMEELHKNRTIHTVPLDVLFYKKLNFVPKS